MIRKLKRQARNARLKLAGHGPSTTEQGETTMDAPETGTLQIPADLQRSWDAARLRPGGKVTKDPIYRFGMVVKINSARRDGDPYCWKCLACRDDFVVHFDAVTHDCEYEAAYREYTGRPAQAWTYSKQRGRKAGTRNRVKDTAPAPVTLVIQPAPAPAPVPEPVPAGTPTSLTLEPEAFVRWMHATLAERDAAVAERDKAVAALDFSVIKQEEIAKELRLKTHDLVLAQNENQKLRVKAAEPITAALSLENQQVYGEYLKKIQ